MSTPPIQAPVDLVKRLVLVTQVSLGGAMLALAAPAAHGAPGDFIKALTGGKPSFFSRLRYENAKEDTFRSADAFTLRTQLGYTTGDFHGFSVLLQAEDVRAFGAENFNSTLNGNTQFTLVADPDSTEVNQALLIYKGIPATTVKYGRQVINYDNQRFIGAAGWRQNEQTFDGLTIANTSLPATLLQFAHITNVNRIFGDDHPTRRDGDIKGELINLAYSGFKPVKIVAYGYFLDFEPTTFAPPVALALPTASNKTIGLRLDGSYPLAAVKLLYTAEYAEQSDYRDGLSTIDADYLNLAIGVDVKGVAFKLGHEVLGGNGVYAFQTPLSTLHAHNGWADRFLVTPVNGIKDTFLSVSGAVMGFNLFASYRDYSSDNLSISYGREWNLQAVKKLNANLTLTAKYAAYSADSEATGAQARDLDRLWLQAELQF